MKQLLILFILCLISCNDGIDDSLYRNSNYVFYKKDGDVGVWQKIGVDSDYKYEKGKLSYFFDDGNIFATVEVIDSFPNRIVRYYNDEKIAETNYYKNNNITKTLKKDGYYKEYSNRKGILYGKGLIKNNKEQGEWEEFDKDGDLERIVNYKEGLRHGEFKEFHKNGIIKTIGKFWNGYKKDTIKWFFEDGKLRSIEVTQLDTINKTSQAIVHKYYNSGTLHQKITTLNEKRNGIAKMYYENGTLMQSVYYENDELNGEATFFYESGVLKSKGKFINHKPNGELNFYNEKGKLFQTDTYNNGQLIDTKKYQ